MQTSIPITVTEKTFIKKYNQGANPEVDKPFEIVKGPDKVYKGQEAIEYLQQLGYSIADFTKIGE